MKKLGEAFIGIDAAKARNAVAVAEEGRGGEIRYLGEFDASPRAEAGHEVRAAAHLLRLTALPSTGRRDTVCIA